HPPPRPPPSPLSPYTTLFRSADVALYKAKGETRMAFRRFDHAMDEVMVKKRAMNAHMKTALDDRQFRLALQPIFSAQTGKLASRSEEHTSELQSRGHLVCRLL